MDTIIAEIEAKLGAVVSLVENSGRILTELLAAPRDFDVTVLRLTALKVNDAAMRGLVAQAEVLRGKLMEPRAGPPVPEPEPPVEPPVPEPEPPVEPPVPEPEPEPEPPV